MVNTSDAKASFRDHRSKSKLQLFYTSRLDATAARTYSDDAHIRGGALSAPRTQFRPGQRDDEVGCSFASMLPVL